MKWIWVCHRGRDCAWVHASIDRPLPNGMRLQVMYTCDGCGTVYIGGGDDRRKATRGEANEYNDRRSASLGPESGFGSS
jgi:hypothetical protein